MFRISSLAAFTLIASCATSSAPKRLVEPDHTFLHVMCMQSGVYDSVCTCAEAKAIEETGITKVGDDEVVGQKFIESLQSHVEACNVELKKEYDPNSK